MIFQSYFSSCFAQDPNVSDLGNLIIDGMEMMMSSIDVMISQRIFWNFRKNRRS